MQPAAKAFKDDEVVTVTGAGQEWLVSWHPPGDPPSGTPHGSAALCFVTPECIALVSRDGERWGLPGGRPEGDETWNDTLCREVEEEACATVVEAHLLGFSRGQCVSGGQLGTVLVRAFWHAQVELAPWNPVFEMPFRRVYPVSAVREILQASHVASGDAPVVLRVFDEAVRSIGQIAS
jgi:8-oxo-dGTP pyrophosphatase MutT (NUDIX family)